jgi:hypothetical protein
MPGDAAHDGCGRSFREVLAPCCLRWLIFISAINRKGEKKRATPVLNGIEFSLNRGETVGIVGGSGAGKTTLALILSGLLPWDRGEIRLEGMPLMLRSRENAARVHKMCADCVAATGNRVQSPLEIGSQLEGTSRGARCATGAPIAEGPIGSGGSENRRSLIEDPAS